MQIGEQYLIFSQQRPLRRERFLDLDDHVGTFEYFLRGSENFCPEFPVIIITCVDSDTGVGFDKNFVPRSGKFPNTFRHQPNAIFIGLCFLWHSNPHFPMLRFPMVRQGE